MNGKRNLILLTIDSLRADHLGCLGYSKEVSPFIDDLAKRGALFSQAISNGPNTPFSFSSMLTSSYPLEHLPGEERGLPLSWLFLSEKRKTIAEVLKRNGYSTATFHSNPWISSFFHYDRGFDVYEDLKKSSGRNYILRNVSILNKILFHLHRGYSALYEVILRGKPKQSHRASVINKKAINWLQNQSNNFFIWLHYMDVHLPYIPPECTILERINALRVFWKVRKYKQSLSEGDLKTLVNLYDGEIRYVNREIGTFLNEIKKMGVSLDNTYVILTADHGEKLMEHGKVGHGLFDGIYDEVIRVPLIICGPGIKEGIVIKDQVCLLDLGPTIIDLLKVQEFESFRGTSLLPLMSGEKSEKRGIISEAIGDRGRKIFSYRTEEWKYMLVLDENGNQVRAELYDLRNDPKEKENVIETRKEKAKEFKSKLFDHILMEERERAERLDEKKGTKMKYDREKKEEIERRLKSLGYM